MPALAASAPEDVLLGVNWDTSQLVSFDPRAGSVLARHITLNPRGSYTGLAYDRNHHRLYAIAQDTRTLSVVDTDTLQTVNIVSLRVDSLAQALTDTVALAYDPVLDRLFTVVGHWMHYPLGPIRSQLATLNPATGELAIVGRIDGPWIESLAFSETDRQLYAIGVYGVGSWDSSYRTNVLRVSPDTGQAETLFVTSYHTMLGFALREPFTFFSWINWTSHIYGLTDLSTQTVTLLGNADSVFVLYAMIYKNFSLPERPVPIPPVPVSFIVGGSVSSVWDPEGRLGGRVMVGHRFAGKLTYDAADPFQVPDPNNSAPNGFSLTINGFKYVSSRMTVSITNDRYNGSDHSLTDEFHLSATMSPLALTSWTLTDQTGRALSAGNVLPEDFDLSDWSSNGFLVSGYDVCCESPVYSFFGSVDHLTRTESNILHPTPRPVPAQVR